jgi:6-phosphofructokinase 1
VHKRGWEIVGIREGYDGLLYPEHYPEGGVVTLTPANIGRIAHLGGTILGTTNRGDPFRMREPTPDGGMREIDGSDKVLDAMRAHRLEALIVVGGDGSLAIANRLHEKGLRLVGVPKTIDNDLDATAMTFGYHSAVSFATECIDRLHVTAPAHRRLIVVEVMGRHAGWIALNAGIAGGADAILIPEIPYDLARVAVHLKAQRAGRRSYAIVVVAEGAHPAGGSAVVKSRESGRVERLGGIGELVAARVPGLAGGVWRGVVRSGTCCAAARRPRSIASSVWPSGRPRCGRSPRGRTASWWPSTRRASSTCRSSRRSRA